jgi:hypothetical protein
MKTNLKFITLIASILTLTGACAYAFGNCGEGREFGCKHVPGQVSLVCGCYPYSK